MNLTIHFLLISSLSILITKSNPIENIKRRIKKLIEYEATNVEAEESYHNLKLEEEGFIGESKLSVVWKGTHKNQMVAVKIYFDEHAFQHERERFEKLDASDPGIEARGIPRVHYCGPFLIHHYAIAMSLFEESLNDRWEKQKKQKQNISELSILLIFKRGVQILEYLEEKKVLHNDIKPANIFLRGQEVFIGDFSLASLHGWTDFGHTLEFASSNFHRGRKRFPMDDFESLVFSLWYVAWDNSGKFWSSRSKPVGKSLAKWKRNGTAKEKMMKKCIKFKDPIVQEAFRRICAEEMLKNEPVPDYKLIISILDDAITKVHGGSGTLRFEWLTGESSSGA